MTNSPGSEAAIAHAVQAILDASVDLELEVRATKTVASAERLARLIRPLDELLMHLSNLTVTRVRRLNRGRNGIVPSPNLSAPAPSATLTRRSGRSWTHSRADTTHCASGRIMKTVAPSQTCGSSVMTPSASSELAGQRQPNHTGVNKTQDPEKRYMGTMVGDESSRPKVLIVDDEPELVRVLTLRLNSAGYETLSASDGMAANELAFSQQPDLVLLDIGLPLRDGYEVAIRLRLVERTAHIPIVFLTARTWDLDKARHVRPNGYLVKPYEPSDLLKIVGRLTATTWKGNDPRFME